jgi:hypothetical protein
MARVFNIYKFVGDENITDKDAIWALETGWPQRYHGKTREQAEKEVGRGIGVFIEEWTDELPEKDIEELEAQKRVYAALAQFLADGKHRKSRRFERK